MDQFFDEFIAELENIGNIRDEENQVEQTQTVDDDDSQEEHASKVNDSRSNNSKEDELECQFANISCTACRKSHLACDRIKPSCSECAMRKRSCQYIPPKKRGRAKGEKKKTCSPITSSSSSSTSPTNTSTTHSKNKKLAIIAPSHGNRTTNNQAKRGASSSPVTGYHPYLSSKQQTTHMTRERNLLKGSLHHSIINYFFDFVDVNFDFLSREQMIEMVSNVDLYEREYSVRTMLLAIQSLCEQSMSQTDRSLISFRESVNYSSYAHPVDFCTKVAKVLLALFSIGEGQTELALNYLNYIKSLQNDPYLDDANKLKFKIIASKGESHITFGDDDVGNIDVVGKSFTRFYDAYSNEKKYDIESINKGINLENAASALSLIYSVRDILYNKNINKKLSDPQKQIKHLSIELMHGYGLFATLKHLNFNENGLNELVEKVEDLLSNFSLTLPLYSFHNLTAFVYYRVNQFSSIRNQIIEKIGQGRNARSIFEDEEEKKYFEKVLLHIKMVNSFSARYRMVYKMFPRLLRELNSIIKWKFDLQMTCLSRCITDDMSIGELKESSSYKEDSNYLSCLEKTRASNHLYSI